MQVNPCFFGNAEDFQSSINHLTSSPPLFLGGEVKIWVEVLSFSDPSISFSAEANYTSLRSLMPWVAKKANGTERSAAREDDMQGDVRLAILNGEDETYI